MGNHSEQAGSKKSISTWAGSKCASIRESGTLNKNTFYYAIRLDDGKRAARCERGKKYIQYI